MMSGRAVGFHAGLCLGGAILAASIAWAGGVQEKATRGQDPIEAAIQESWKAASSHDQLWMRQDRTQRECTVFANRPPDRESVAIIEREWSAIVFPSDGEVFGDWKRGESLARDSGMRPAAGVAPASTPAQDRPPISGQCLACHQLDARDVASMHSGPSLIGYGRLLGQSQAQRKLLYEQIYNSNAVIACSVMPRFGTHKVLTPEQIRDIVAYLLSPQSPVNSVTSAHAAPKR